MQQRARRPGPDSRVRRRNRRILGITGVLANSFCLVFPRRRTESPDGTRSSAGPLPDGRHRFPWWTWLTLTKLVAVDSRPVTRPSNPYQPVGDYLSNVGRFKIIESTLRGPALPLLNSAAEPLADPSNRRRAVCQRLL